MKLLLDTHALLWWALDHPRLASVARDAIGHRDSEVFVSVASVWEVVIKFRSGKLRHAEGFVTALSQGNALAGMRELPISSDHAVRAGLLEIPHKDPFDRMLIAQARIEGMTLVSNEAIFDAWGVDRIWK